VRAVAAARAARRAALKPYRNFSHAGDLDRRPRHAGTHRPGRGLCWLGSPLVHNGIGQARHPRPGPRQARQKWPENWSGPQGPWGWRYLDTLPRQLVDLADQADGAGLPGRSGDDTGAVA
jgi:hypothetical protein